MEVNKYHRSYLKDRKILETNRKLTKREIRKIKFQNFKRSFVFSISFGLLLVFFIFLVNRHFYIKSQAQEIISLEEKIENNNKEIASLNQSLKPYKDSEKVEEYAKVNLGMVHQNQAKLTKIDTAYNFDIKDDEKDSKSIIAGTRNFLASIFGAFSLD